MAIPFETLQAIKEMSASGTMQGADKKNDSATGSKGDMISYLFSLRDSAHIAHLTQKDRKLSTHSALGSYYDSLLDLTDSFTECYFGLYGPKAFSIQATEFTNPVEDIKKAYDAIEVKRKAIKETFLQNIIDEIQQLNAHTLYKLKYVG